MRVIFLVFLLNVSVFGCHCSNITFDDYVDVFKDSMQEQAKSLGEYQGNILKHIATIKEQNKALESQNAIIKENLLRKKELIFYLKQKIELE